MSVTLQVDPEVRAWRPDDRTLSRIARIAEGVDVTARIWPRRLVGQITGKTWLEPYAFRARNLGGTLIDLFADRTETPESMAWLIAHELAHSRLRSRPQTLAELDLATPAGLDPVSDLYHQVSPEERYCDGIATRLIGKRLDREWWRERVRAYG